MLFNEEFRLAGIEGLGAFGLKIIFKVDISLLRGETDLLQQLQEIHCNAMGEYQLTQHLYTACDLVQPHLSKSPARTHTHVADVDIASTV